MYIQTNQPAANFKAKVSAQTKCRLFSQIKESKYSKQCVKPIKIQILKKIEQIESWGRSSSEVKICQNDNGDDILYLSREVAPEEFMERPISGIGGKCTLSRFLRLHECDITSMEEKIADAYKRIIYFRPSNPRK